MEDAHGEGEGIGPAMREVEGIHDLASKLIARRVLGWIEGGGIKRLEAAEEKFASVAVIGLEEVVVGVVVLLVVVVDVER